MNRQACRKPVVGKSTNRILYFQDGNDSGSDRISVKLVWNASHVSNLSFSLICIWIDQSLAHMSFDVFNGLFNGLISHIELSLKNKARLDKLWKTVKTSKKKFRQKLRMDKPCTSCISLSPKTLIELFSCHWIRTIYLLSFRPVSFV